MDFARPASAGRPLIRSFCALVVALLCFLPGVLNAQSPDAQDSADEKAKQLFAAERWQEIVSLAESISAPSADLDYYYGTALAKLGRWDDATRAFEQGSRLGPFDARFPVELGGLAFKQKQYPQAVAYLRRALRLAPDDAYASELLATVYLLQGNLEAAIKYWNRVGKPEIANVQSEPVPKVKPALLDQAFAFAPASTLRLADFQTSDARVRGLGIFSAFRFELLARDDEKFDLAFRNHERNGLGSSKLEILTSLFSGLPAQTISPEFFNLRQAAINLGLTYRWDAQKRRWNARLSAPFGRGAQRRYAIFGDWRDENWDIRTSFTGPAADLGSFKLQRKAVGGEIIFIPNGRWNWAAGAEFSHRDFGNVLPGPALNSSLLAEGFQLKQVMRVNADVWRVPERRMVFAAEASSQAGRIWSQPEHSFLKLQTGLRFHWFPRPEGDDYEFDERLSAGTTVGDVPFDELFMLGLLGDNDILMRGHVTTHDGKKGSGPVGREYFVSNWGVDKNIFRKFGITFKLGPFVDIGKITDASPSLGSHKWLYDVGIQAKVRLFGVGVVLAYGKDLRSGNNAFTASMQ